MSKAAASKTNDTFPGQSDLEGYTNPLPQLTGDVAVELNKRKPKLSRRAQKEATRQLIIEAALDCFNKKGFEGTSVGDICEAAGISRGLIHFHFQSKEDLVAEVESLLFRRILDQIDASTAKIGPSIQSADEAFDTVWAALKESRVLLPAFFGLLGHALSDKKFQLRFAGFLEDNRELVTTALRKLLGPIADNLVVPVDDMAEILMGSVMGLSIMSTFTKDQKRADALFLQLKQLAMGAVPIAIANSRARHLEQLLPQPAKGA